MFVGRTQELERLEGLYASEKSGIFVLYGRSGIGKTALIRRFLQGKTEVYYAARRVTGKEQLLCMCREWHTTEATDVYDALSAVYASKNSGTKLVLVLDEFDNLFEDKESFLSGFLHFYSEHHADGSLLVLLLSSTIHWVENEMTGVLGNAARLIGGFIKLKEFSFMELAVYHKNSSVRDNIYTEAVLGGVPAYLVYWRETESFEENVKRLFLTEDAPLFREAEHYLKQGLRELSAYNSILAALAQGKNKLNDMYEYTGFSRAKISVYLKNLMERDITEKMFSFETGANRDVQKGLYRIREPFLRFWYRFVYPNCSAIAMGEGDRVYREKIQPYLTEFVKEAFRDVCEEYLQVLNGYQQLSYIYRNFGIWHGKSGRIDVLASVENKVYLAGFCDCGTQVTDVDAYQEYEAVLQCAGVVPEELYCFSMQGFTEEFRALARERGICLVCAKDM